MQLNQEKSVFFGEMNAKEEECIQQIFSNAICYFIYDVCFILHSCHFQPNPTQD